MARLEVDPRPDHSPSPRQLVVPTRGLEVYVHCPKVIKNGVTGAYFPDPQRDHFITIQLLFGGKTVNAIAVTSIDELDERDLSDVGDQFFCISIDEVVRTDLDGSQTTMTDAEDLIRLEPVRNDESSSSHGEVHYWIRTFGLPAFYTISFLANRFKRHRLRHRVTLLKQIVITLGTELRQHISLDQRPSVRRSLPTSLENPVFIHLLSDMRSHRDQGHLTSCEEVYQTAVNTLRVKENSEFLPLFDLERSLALLYMGRSSEAKSTLQAIYCGRGSTSLRQLIEARTYVYLAFVHFYEGYHGIAGECLEKAQKTLDEMEFIADHVLWYCLQAQINLRYVQYAARFSQSLVRNADSNVKQAKLTLDLLPSWSARYELSHIIALTEAQVVLRFRSNGLASREQTQAMLDRLVSMEEKREASLVHRAEAGLLRAHFFVDLGDVAGARDCLEFVRGTPFLHLHGAIADVEMRLASSISKVRESGSVLETPQPSTLAVESKTETSPYYLADESSCTE